MPADDPLARQTKVPIADMAGRSLAVFARRGAPQIYDDMMDCFAANKVSPQFAFEAGLLETLVNAVQVSGVLGVVPASVGSYRWPHVCVVPLSAPSTPEVFLFIAWRRADDCRVYREFIAWTRKRCRAHLEDFCRPAS